MHRALIVPSKYAPSSGYLDREGWRHSSRVLGARLKEHGYAVETLEPGPGLVKSLRQALATEDPLSAVVIVFCGYLLLTETQEPALLLADEQVIALRLEQLCSKAARTFGRVLLVIDAVRGSSTRVVQDANPGAPETSPEVLLAQMAANTVTADNSGVLLSVAPWGAPDAVPDHGLCQRLSDILGELDDTQAMSTPELEFTLNSTHDESTKVTCRHSKPAFVFLPARRFHSQPPLHGTPAAHRQVLDASANPYDGRDDEDRSAWTPPPETPLQSAVRESRPSMRPSFAPLHLPATGALPPPPVPAVPRTNVPGLGLPPPLPGELPSTDTRASAPTATEPAVHSPSSSSDAPLRPLGVPPPLPGERAAASLPPLPPLPGPLPPPVALPVLPPELPPLPPVPGPLTQAHEAAAHPASELGERSPAAWPPDTETSEPSRDETSGPVAPLDAPAARSPEDDTPVGAPAARSPEPTTDAPAPQSRSDEARPDGAVSHRSGPPPRRHRDSASNDAANSEAAPSLPPLALSPESWRPQNVPPAAPRDEAALLALAHAALHQGQPALALAQATQCLDSFPESAAALQIVATVLVGEGRFEDLAQVYERLIVSLRPNTAAQLCAAAARLWHTELRNSVKARELLERGLLLDSNNASLRRELADLLDESGDGAAALEHAFAAVRLNPMSPQAGIAAFQRLEQTAAKERTFNVACVLSFLGQATNRVSDTVAAYRTPTLPKPSRALTEDDFHLGLDVTPIDPELTGLLAALEPVARLLQLPKPKVQRQLLDSLRAEDVERSTTMLARTFGWSCRLLTLGSPGLFLAESDALPTRLTVDQMGFAVGKSLGRGLSLPELVFIWTRSLGMARAQTRIVQSVPTAVRLTHLLQACRCALDLEAVTNSEVKQLAKALKKSVPAQTWSMLSTQLSALEPGYELRVERWKQEADRIANALGLVACGDPELAARTLDRFPLAEGAPKRQQLAELLAFSLSDNYEQLRFRLGLHLG